HGALGGDHEDAPAVVRVAHVQHVAVLDVADRLHVAEQDADVTTQRNPSQLLRRTDRQNRHESYLGSALPLHQLLALVRLQHLTQLLRHAGPAPQLVEPGARLDPGQPALALDDDALAHRALTAA